LDNPNQNEKKNGNKIDQIDLMMVENDGKKAKLQETEKK